MIFLLNSISFSLKINAQKEKKTKSYLGPTRAVN